MNKNRFLLIVPLLMVFISCGAQKKVTSTTTNVTIQKIVNEVVNNWHKAAAEANYEAYFNLMTKDGVFIGTDLSLIHI